MKHLFKKICILVRTVRICGIWATSLSFHPLSMVQHDRSFTAGMCSQKYGIPLPSAPWIGPCYLPRRNRSLVFLILQPACVVEALFWLQVSKSYGALFFYPAPTHRVENLFYPWQSGNTGVMINFVPACS